MENKKITFRLTHVFEDGTKEEPQIVPINELPWEDLKTDRRGFLGAGLAASAALLLLNGCMTGRNVTQNCQKALAHKDGVNALTFSLNGKILVSGSEDDSVKFWKTPEGALMNTIDGLGITKCLGTTSDGSVIVSVNSGSSRSYWSLGDRGKEKMFDAGNNGDAVIIVCSPDGKTLACGTTRGKIELRDAATGDITKILHAHKEKVRSLAYSPQGNFLISSGDNDIIIWGPKRYNLLQSVYAHEKSISGLFICPDEKSFITSGYDGKLYQWSLPDCLPVKSSDYNQAGSIHALAGDRNGRFLVTSSEKEEIILWHLPDLSPLHKLTGHTDPVYALAVSPDGTLLASGAKDGRIRLWRLPDGKSPDFDTGTP